MEKNEEQINHQRFTYMQFLKSLYYFYCNAQWLSCLKDDPNLHGRETKEHRPPETIKGCSLLGINFGLYSQASLNQ
jgi:hypothetical protein